MEDWKQEYINSINESNLFNDIKKKHMIKLAQKSQDDSRESFLLRSDTIKKIDNIHRNYAKFDTFEIKNIYKFHKQMRRIMKD